ncbi:maleylpyruvate isomerase family mycothiol-dependent enzyme [Actinocrispum sp. NPDC049592]|uniref:maleylpyruvate isomerase family mycothiol-dependent enzyme n=1 Tax=Actinocrispum sp. NPDC049592 TaxID=3154835 RepID=UPI00341661A7
MRRIGVGTTVSYGRVYAAMAAALDALLGELAAADWATIAAYGDWSVHDLVAHLAATDSLLADQLRLTPSLDTIDTRTDATVARERTRQPADTWDLWRTQAALLCLQLADLPGDHPISLRPVTMPLADIMASRAFETWVHAGDIAAAVGRDLPAPPGEHVHRIADLGARILPSAAVRGGVVLNGRSLRLVLTGEGGGSWLVPGSSDPAAELELDVLAFCRLMGDRLSAADAEVTIRGDEALGHQVLAAAASLAGR